MQHEIIAALLEAEKLMNDAQANSASREMAVALTNLQTAMLWADKALKEHKP